MPYPGLESYDMTSFSMTDRVAAVNTSAHPQTSNFADPAAGVAPAPVVPLRRAVDDGSASARPLTPTAAAPVADDLAPLLARAERAVEGALATGFDRDPVFESALSRLVSVGNSLQRRDGLLLEEAVRLGIARHPRLRLVEERPRFGLTQDALDHVARFDARAAQSTDLIQPAIPFARMAAMDVVFIDERTNIAVAIDAKRGGRIGASQNRDLAKKICGISLTLRRYG